MFIKCIVIFSSVPDLRFCSVPHSLCRFHWWCHFLVYAGYKIHGVHSDFITSAVFVCQLVTSHESYWWDLCENFTRDVSGEEPVKFWKSSTSGSWRSENWKTSTAFYLFTAALYSRTTACSYTVGLAQRTSVTYSWWCRHCTAQSNK